jgi:N-acetylmuramoyl-L-alanine amidase
VRKNIAVILILTTFFSLGAFSFLNPKNVKVTKIVIDPGHGGKDPGCIGQISNEKDVALDVSLELAKILKELLPDVEVSFTRSDDRFIGLYERAKMANVNDADLFISIHCNADPRKQAYGTETWVMGIHKSSQNLEEVVVRENSVILMEDDYDDNYDGFDPKSPESYILFNLYQSAYINNSLNLAGKIENQFENRVKRNSRGVKQAGFLVLWKTSMPSVLIELGFLTHAKEERYLNDKLGQTYLASAIFRAIRDYKSDIESMN